MKYIKMLGLLAVAAAALMAFAGTAAATYVTSPAGTTYTGAISAASEGKTTLSGSFVTVECGKSTVEGKIEAHSTTESTPASGKISSLTFTECNFPTTVNKAGSLLAHTEVAKTSNGNGTLTSTGAEITISTSVGQCIFTTNGTDIGQLTGSKNLSNKTATLDIKSAGIPRTGGSAGFLCGSSGTWNGSYIVNSPDYLDID